MPRQMITISRELGSGGRLIGKKVADLLGYAFYDNEIIDQTAKISGFSSERITKAEERITNSFLYNIAMGTGYGLSILNGNSREAMPLSAQVYLAQRQAIQDLAKKGPCVFVGRCADYILKNEPKVLKCFVYSSLKERVRRAVDEYGMDKNGIEKEIAHADKTRAMYYYAVTDQKWGDPLNYDLMINSGSIGIEEASNLIVSMVKGNGENE